MTKSHRAILRQGQSFAIQVYNNLQAHALPIGFAQLVIRTGRSNHIATMTNSLTVPSSNAPSDVRTIAAGEVTFRIRDYNKGASTPEALEEPVSSGRPKYVSFKRRSFNTIKRWLSCS
jgi:hypothetical protein